MKKTFRKLHALGEQGMALLLTLLVTVILAVVVLEFNYLIRVYATLSGNLVDDLQAQTAAQSAVEQAKAVLINDLSADRDKGILADTLDEEWATEITRQANGSAAKAEISDEMAKLNLNSLVKGSTSETDIESTNQDMVDSVKHLFELLDLDPSMVDCIVDWIDENDQEEPFGAEDSYYQSLTPPMHCKNGPLDNVEELLLIKGFDPEILYGDEETPGLVDYVTVFGDPNGKVNINTADEKVLTAVLKSESEASMIVDLREERPFETAVDIAGRLPGLHLKNKMTTASSYFLVSAVGRTPAEGDPAREVQIKAFLKREIPEGSESEDQYLRVNTAFWKIGR